MVRQVSGRDGKIGASGQEGLGLNHGSALSGLCSWKDRTTAVSAHFNHLKTEIILP